MGQRVRLGEITNPTLQLDPKTGLIAWQVTGIPGVDGARVEVRGPGDSAWKDYGTCGVGPEGTCGGSENTSWLKPDSNLDFRIVALQQSDPAYLRQVLTQSVRAGAAGAPVTAAVASGASSPGAPADGSPGWLWQSTLIGGIPNAYVVGGGVLAGLILAKRKR